MENIKIIALGGQDERGKNLYCIEASNGIFVFDAGSVHPSKGILGINYVIPNFNYLKKNVKKIKGIFITKVNDNCSGALYFILKELNVPVYVSELSLFILKKSFKFKANLIVVREREVINFKENKVEIFLTTTSSPYSLGFALHTKIGTVIFTGDYIFDAEISSLFKTDISHLSEIAKRSKILLLMSDSSSANRISYTSPNHRAVNYIKNYVESSKGRIILVCFSEDIYRIIELLSVVNINNFEIGIRDSILIDTFKFLLLNSSIKIENSNQIKNIINIKNINKSIIIISGTRETLYNKIIKIAAENDSEIEISETDTIILSTPPMPGSELNYANVLDELARTNAKVIDLTDKKVWNMNASYEDIKLMTSIFSPKLFMPVRSLYKDFIIAKNAAINAGVNLENVIIAENGDLITIDKFSKFKIKKKYTTVGELFTNNNIKQDVASTVLNERRKLSTDGVLIVGAMIDKKTKLLCSTIDTQLRGVIYIKDFSEMSKKIQDIIENILKEEQRNFQLNKNFSIIDVQKNIRNNLYSYIRKTTGKLPIILVSINEI